MRNQNNIEKKDHLNLIKNIIIGLAFFTLVCGLCVLLLYVSGVIGPSEIDPKSITEVIVEPEQIVF